MDKFYNLLIYVIICLLIFLIMYLKFFYLNVFEPFTEANSFQIGVCKTCPPGEKVNSDKNGCDSCPEGNIVNGGTCERCSDGKEPNRERTRCVDCPTREGIRGKCCPNGVHSDEYRCYENSNCKQWKNTDHSKYESEC